MMQWLEATAFSRAQSAELKKTFDVISPPRGHIPSLEPDFETDELVQATAIDANMAFSISAALKGQAGAIPDLEAQLIHEFGSAFPGSALFRHWRGESTTLHDLDKVCADAIGLLRTSEHINPQPLWKIGLRLFERIGQSSFKSSLTPIIAEWLRAQWTRIVMQEAFRLSQPSATIPGIEAVLINKDNSETFVAALLLASEDAVGAPLAVAYRDRLKNIANGMKTASDSSDKLGV